MRNVRDAAQAVSNEHKDMHATISKLGKAIDKVYIYTTFYYTCSMNDHNIIELQCRHLCYEC